MKALTFCVLLGFGLVSLRAQPSAELLLRPAAYSVPKVSPDGQYLATLFRDAKGAHVAVIEIATGKNWLVSPHTARRPTPSFRGPPLDVRNFQWAGSRRLVLEANSAWIFVNREPRDPNPMMRSAGPTGFNSYSGYTGVDVQGTNWGSLPGMPLSTRALSQRLSHEFIWETQGVFYVPDQNGVMIVRGYEHQPSDFPDLFEIDTLSGHYERVMRNPGTVMHWILDAKGIPTLAVGRSGAGAKLLKRANDRGDKWEEVADLESNADDLKPLAFQHAEGIVVFLRPGPDGLRVVQEYDLLRKAWRAPLVAAQKYDFDTTASRVFVAASTGQLLGIDLPHVQREQRWFDPTIDALIRELKGTNGGATVEVLSLDDIGKRIVVHIHDPRDRGYFSFVDLVAGTAKRIAVVAPWITPSDLAECRVESFKARDGLELECIVTSPARPHTGPAPLVLLQGLLPHPFNRRMFDPEAQFFATRGYAVMRVNHRGTLAQTA